jgi:N-acyl-D-aspartate/D-glutamate deacylase
MLDYLIRGGMVVDGTGRDGFVADVGIRDGRVATIGKVDDSARVTIDAAGLVVCPGFIDPHTHYDAQLFWDPMASPSNLHGVTSIIGGNCGFTIAPLDPANADYLLNMMVKVEGMPKAALENGVPWDWHSFGDYLGRLDGHLGVNAGFMVGHCALRRQVMGKDSVGQPATVSELEEMRRLLADGIEAGGLGLSTTQSFTHSDGEGQPVPSRWATADEVLDLCDEVGNHPGTFLEWVTDGCTRGFRDDEVELMVNMSLRSGRPLNWNVLTIDSAAPERYRRQLGVSALAERRGGRVVALTMPTLVGMNMSFLNFCALFSLPDWDSVLGLPVPERIEKLKDPAVQNFLEQRAASPDAGVFSRLTGWGLYRIGDTYSPANQGLQGRVVSDIAWERGVGDFTALLQVVLADDLRTVLWPTPTDDDPESWRMRAEAWGSVYTLLGGSDAGAHLDRMCGAPYTTDFISDCLRGRKLIGLEDAVRHLTDAPARLFGLRDRGRLEEGWLADVVVFDPETIASTEIRFRRDLPGGAGRLYAGAVGVEKVFVNGRLAVDGAQPTGDLAGVVLRSGRETETVAVPAAGQA